MENNTRYLRLGATIAMTITIIVLSIFIWKGEMKKQELKDGLVQLSGIQYGLFNIDEWKKILIRVLEKNIEEFELDDGDREKLKAKVAKFLNETVDDFEARYHQEEKNKNGNIIQKVAGDLRSAVVSATKLFEHVKEDIPEFSVEIVDFVNDPENAVMIKNVLTEKLDEYAAETFAEMDYSVRDSICAKYGFEDKDATISYLEKATDELKKQQQPLQITWGVLVLLTLLLVLFISPHGHMEYLSLLITSIVLLVVGITLPMIDIDARISSLSFQLLGEDVVFENQVVYRKSKGILEVVQLMLTNGQVQTKLVGVLVLVFSLLLPFTKLICSLVYLYAEKARNNKFIRVIVFRSGKWSMADVMVVAIFMSFIGFSSIVSEQMKQLEGFAPALEMLTTNNSELLFGFYAFVSFVFMSMLISRHLHNVSTTDKI